MFKNLIEYIHDNKLKIIASKKEVNIINFKEILGFDEKQIIIASNEAIITISGNNLIINKLLDNEVLIIGEIEKIDME